MKRRPAADGAAGMSMFPFLAVLLCTMGALIVLLVVISRQARQHALEAAPQQADEQLQFQLETARWRIDVLKESREKTAAQLADARLELSHLEDHGRRLRGELTQVANELNALADATEVDASQRDLWHQLLGKLDESILDARDELDRQAAKGRRSSYAVIPYRGPNETLRRPIYVECRDDTIVIQPEGLVLHEDDFPDSMGPSNPLAAVVRAATEAINERRFASGRSPAADDVGQPYPLLLVRPNGIAAYYAARAALSSWDQEFGYELIEQEWDLEFPPADAQLEQAMQLAVDEARQRQQLRLAAAPRVSSQQSFRVAPTRGGMVVEHDPLRPAGSGGRYGNAGNYRSSSGGGFAGRFGGSDGGAGERGPSYSGRYEGRSESLAEQTAAGSGASPYDAPSGGSVGSPSTSAYSSGAEGDALTESNTAGGPALHATAGPSQAAGQGQTAGGTASEQQTTPGQFTAGTSGNSSGQTGSPPSGHSGGSNSAGGNPPPATPSGPDFRVGDVESIANSRGENWGLPRAAHTSVPVTRPIRMECHSGSLVLTADGGDSQQPRVVPLGFRTESSIDDLVSAVWERIDRWGIAGAGMYWRPILSVEVQPGGEDRFRDLEILLEGSGLLVESRFVSIAADPAMRK